ncbi:MAG: hypothetical protein AAGA11_08235 [Pseudomonadota bacterium]
MIKDLMRHIGRAVGIAMLGVGGLSAATIDVVVHDRKGNPVPDVVVLAESSTGEPLPFGPGAQTVFEIDQHHMMFDPYISVVPVGASVNFFNSDPTAHHVYSFSKTKRFTLPLYKGKAPDPVVFDKTGLVTLGCNIHDHMVGYVVVAESHVHARTDAAGKATLTFDGDVEELQVRIWSPRIRDRQNRLAQRARAGATVQFDLAKKLKKPYAPHNADSSEWEDYAQ